MLCSSPSGAAKCRSKGSASGPSRSGSLRSAVPTLSSRYSSDWTICRVDPERDVVDEDRAVDSGEVDRALQSLVAVGVQGADDVVTVDAQIERQVIAGARRDAHVRETALHRHLGDDRLRSVPAGHAERAGARVRGVERQSAQVVAAGQQDRRDAPLAALVGEVKPLDLSAARPWIHDQDRTARRRQALPAGGVPGPLQGQARRARGQGDEDDVDRQGHEGPVADQDRQCRGHRDDRDDEAQPAHPPAGDERDPPRRHRDPSAEERAQRLEGVVDRQHDQHRHGARPCQ